MRKLLIGYDGSEHSDAAIDDLQRAGLPQDIEAVVLTVADVFLPLPWTQRIGDLRRWTKESGREPKKCEPEL